MGVLDRVFGREIGFFEYFERHADLTIAAAKEFLALAESAENIAGRARRIKEIEHEADVVTHQCLEAWHRTTRWPTRREEVHRLITGMDDIVDYIEASSDRVSLYELTSMTAECIDLARVLVRSTEEIKIALGELRYVRGDRKLLDRCIEINRLENEADSILRNAVARLFKGSKDPVMMIKWKEIYENLENATDCCEDVANIIEGIVLEQK
jgi:uncharacterized protein Yka (UPF0111/DUF47 family)